MKIRTETLLNVPPNKVEEVMRLFRLAGADAEFIKQLDGNYTIVSTHLTS